MDAHRQPEDPLHAVAGVVFDTDGVIVDSTGLHSRAWKEAFDPCLAEAGQPPFDADGEYLRLVDGRSRLDGAAGLLAARGLRLPSGSPGDRPGTGTVHAVAARKEEAFVRRLGSDPVPVFPGFLRLVQVLGRRGTALAAVSSSRHAPEVLERAGVREVFSAVVAGDDAARLGLPGKPAPDLFLEACRRLGLPAGHCAVVEDALAGVAAGRAGGFRPVIGVDNGGRPAHAADLRAHGADLVVADLAEVAALTEGGRP